MSPFSSRRLRADRTAQLFVQSKLPGYIGEHLPLLREESSGRSLGAICFRQDFLGKEASIYSFSLRRPRAYLPIFFSKDCHTKMASICSPRRLRADRLVPVIPGVAIQAKRWVILLFPSTFLSAQPTLANCRALPSSWRAHRRLFPGHHVCLSRHLSASNLHWGT